MPSGIAEYCNPRFLYYNNIKKECGQMNKLENKTLKEHSYDLGYLIDLRIEQLVQK